MDAQVQIALIFLIGLIARLIFRYAMRKHPKIQHRDGTKEFR